MREKTGSFGGFLRGKEGNMMKISNTE